VTTLVGRRLVLRPLEVGDFAAWREVRRRSADWLIPWEPARTPGQPDVVEDRDAFALRCSARARERQAGSGFGFGVFAEGHLVGEINLSSVHRGAFQSAYVGYWVDQQCAGRGYIPEALVLVIRFAFEDLHLHRLQVAIIPRNARSRRVVEKLGLREEGVARRYIEINGVWEDHVRYAITAEEWDERREELLTAWID
jgi:ribosomal-protein-alanine N-acetyltransferase